VRAKMQTLKEVAAMFALQRDPDNVYDFVYLCTRGPINGRGS
jgi:hypothetical protein